MRDSQAESHPKVTIGLRTDSRAVCCPTWTTPSGTSSSPAGRWPGIPGLRSVAIVTLALGIGLNTAVFTLFDAFALRPMPVPDPHQIVNVYSGTRENPLRQSLFVSRLSGDSGSQPGFFWTDGSWRFHSPSECRWFHRETRGSAGVRQHARCPWDRTRRRPSLSSRGRPGSRPPRGRHDQHPALARSVSSQR